MTYKIILFLLFIITLSGCDDAPLELKQQQLNQDMLVACKDKPCPQVNVDFIQYTGDEKRVKSINQEVTSYILDALHLGNPEGTSSARSVKEGIELFIEDYWRDTSEFPEVNEYEADIMASESFRSEKVATVVLNQYKYTGGAHGYSSVSFINFDHTTGEIIKNEQLIKDKEGLTKLAEKELRIKYNLPKEAAINSSLFWFEDGAFYLSENLGIENGKFIVHYDQYEIASYADGPIDIEIKLETVTPFLNYCLSCKEE